MKERENWKTEGNIKKIISDKIKEKIKKRKRERHNANNKK